MGRSTSICHQRKEPASIAPLPSIKRREETCCASTPPHTQGMVKKKPLFPKYLRRKLSKKLQENIHFCLNRKTTSGKWKLYAGSSKSRGKWPSKALRSRKDFENMTVIMRCGKTQGYHFLPRLYAPWLVRRKWRPMQLPDRPWIIYRVSRRRGRAETKHNAIYSNAVRWSRPQVRASSCLQPGKSRPCRGRVAIRKSGKKSRRNDEIEVEGILSNRENQKQEIVSVEKNLIDRRNWRYPLTPLPQMSSIVPRRERQDKSR